MLNPFEFASVATHVELSRSRFALPKGSLKKMALPWNQFRFTDEGELGSGGLGYVRKIRVIASNAPDKPVGSYWAIKKLHDSWNSNPVMRQRFEREIKALKQMAHESVVSYEGENLDGAEERFYVMPLYTHNLRRWIAANGKQGDWKFIARLGITLAGAMHYAHAQGFIHRDLKPDNILFNHLQPLVVADWGLGYFVHKESKVLMPLTRGGMGTEYYCSFEQWNTGKCDARGDIYSLAMTLDEMYSGQQRSLQLVGIGINSATATASSPGAIKFNDALKSMSQFTPDQRPANMHRVAQLLQDALNAG